MKWAPGQSYLIKYINCHNYRVANLTELVVPTELRQSGRNSYQFNITEAFYLQSKIIWVLSNELIMVELRKI